MILRFRIILQVSELFQSKSTDIRMSNAFLFSKSTLSLRKPLKNNLLLYQKLDLYCFYSWVSLYLITYNSFIQQQINNLRLKKIIVTSLIILLLSFFLEGISDPNIFIFSNWRMNNIVSLLYLWFAFLTTYYLFSLIIEYGIKKLHIVTSKKLIVLLLLTAFISFIWVILIELLFYHLYYKIDSLSETTFYEFDLPLTIVILIIGCVYFYQKNYLKPVIDNLSSSRYFPEIKRLEAFKGTKNLYVSQSDVRIIYLSDKIVWIKIADGQLLHTNDSLSILTDKLSSKLFFRLNRQVIVSRTIVKGYNRLDYQKLEILIDEDFPSDLNLVVSKYNAPYFKKWLTNSA